ncbi:MAG: Holliday junction branch migration protein RuvA [Terrimesophilobacter sp.]
MIATVRGTVLATAGTRAVIEVGGVGLDVTVTPEHALGLRIGTEAQLHTTLVVREDELALFGFTDLDEKNVFELLRGVSGVGPKSAMGVLAAMHPDEVAQAVANDDDAAFRKVSGIGPKTAKLIVVSLTGKIAAVVPRSAKAVAPSISDNVIIALVGLGWSERVAAGAVEEAVADAPDAEQANVPALLRRALSQLGSAGASHGSTSRTLGEVKTR